MRSKKQVLFQSIVSLLVCISMLLGTTFAWFTDSVTSANNIIVSGKLDVELDYLDENNEWQPVTEDIALLDQEAVWEPGHTEVVYLRIKNAGNLALSYLLGVKVLDEVGSVNMAGKDFELSDFIKFGVVESDEQATYATREDARKAVSEPKGIKEDYIEGTELYPADSGRTSEQYATLVVYMPEDVGNDANHASDADIPQIALGVSLVATQTEYESDSFDAEYDSDAVMPAFAFPHVELSVEDSKRVRTNDNNEITKALTLRSKAATAEIPEGVVVAEDAKKVTLIISDLDGSSADVSLEENEEKRSLDVHIEGVAENNTVPMTITIKEAAAVGLNEGNLKLYHVEGDETKPMVLIPFDAEFTAHNQFKYDPATGDIILYMATFSEVALVADTENAWNGTVATAFAGGDGTETNPYLIANADQLAYLNECISNKNDNYGDKHYKLIADINLGGEANANDGIIFYPIGYHQKGGSVAAVALDDAPEAIYEITEGSGNPGSAVADGGQDWYTYGGAIKGTFDGAGHKVSNIYQNTWQLKGNYDGNYWNAAMGLFGYVYGGTIKNLTVDNFSSDGEFTPTGVIAAYAAGNATFENIAITNCKPRVYNTGNGGIIGIAGDTSAANDDHITLKNITVDNSNKISALWGSWDVACGGLVGMYRGNVDGSGNATGDTISFENCHVSAQIDVNNDVCANYQYYAYRYAGMIIGSVRHNTTNAEGKSIPNMEGISAKGCTVNYGDWNDYYYCEFEKNTMASYSEDYQFSRVDKSEIKFDENGNAIGCTHTHTDAEDKRAVYLPFHQLFTGYGWGVSSIGLKEYSGIVTDLDIAEGDNANSVVKFEGKVTEQLANKTEYKLGDLFNVVSDSGVKVVPDALTVTVTNLDENNPVTAVINKNLNNWANGTLKFEGIGKVQITIQDYYFCAPTTIEVNVIERQSVNKFVAKDTDGSVYCVKNIDPVSVGSLFTAVEGVEINKSGVDVTIHKVDENSTVSGTFTRNTDDWAQGTIQFSGTGEVEVTITDNDFCTPATIKLKIEDPDPVVKFETKFTGDFQYRVGNNVTTPVALDTLFKAVESADIKDSAVAVSVETVSGTASGTFNANDDWAQGKIQFSGTGVVKVTITDDYYCTPTELYLEVVDAVNATSATSVTANNVVLLNDCGFGSLEVSGGYTLYGNGFTMTCGSDSAALDTGYAFVTLNNGTLDNVQMVMPNFDHAVLYKSNMTESGNRSETTDKTRYFNVKSGVMASGNSQILNSRISGGRAAVNIAGGNILIDNSRIELGAVASILVGAANSVTLRDVTLVQKPTASTYNSGKTLMGFSVLVICNADGSSAEINLEGELVQNAWVNESDKQYVPTDGQSVIADALKQTDYLHDLDGDGTKESLNLGIAYMPESLTSKVKTTTITDNRTNKADVPYDYAEVSILTGKTYVYSYKNTNGTADDSKTESEYKPNKYGDIITVTYSDTADGLETGKSYGTEGWVYELNVDLDKLSGYALDFSKLSMSVNGTTVTDFKVNGNAKPTSPVAVTAGGVTYTLTATVNGKEYTATYKVTGTETSKDSPTKISGPTTAGFGVAKSYGGDWSGAADVLTGVKIKYWSVAEKKYVEYDFSNFTVPGNAGKLNGTNSYWEYTPDNNDFTLKVTNTVAIHSGKSVYGMPIRGTDGKLYFTISSTTGYVGSGTTSRAVTMQYEFTDNNGGEKLTFTHTFNISYNKDDQYSYSDLSGSGKLTKLQKSSSSGTCIAEGSMITMADGSKKAVEDVRRGDLVMAFDHVSGDVVCKEVALVGKTYADNYNRSVFVFDDDTELNAINEHGIYDLDLNQYVNIGHQNYLDYVGHRFVSVDADGNVGVKRLVDVVTTVESGYKYDVVTNETLTYVVEDTLSVSHEIVMIMNSFEFGDDMTYDVEAMQGDIEKYGLYTYEDFADYCEREVFEQYNMAMMKVGVGKDLYTKEHLVYLLTEIALNEDVQIID